MSKKKALAPTKIRKVKNNRLGTTVDFGNFMGIGPFPTGLPGHAREQVSDARTVFNNMRWYLVSNMRQILSQAYVELGLVQTIVTVPVDDGLRGGVMFKSKQLDEEQLRKLQICMDRNNDIDTAGWGAKWTRLFGGGGILILMDDQDPEEPLDVKAITKDSCLTFRAVDMWELFWDKQNDEGYDPQLQSQDFEHYDYYSEKIHRSRVMRLKGLQAPSFVRPRLRGWGMSVVEALVRSLNQYLKGTDLGFEVLDEFKLDIFKIKNLANTVLSANGQQKVKATIQMLNYLKNYQNALVIDSEDDFDHKQLSFAGLAEAMEGIRHQVAADMRMPAIKLFGQSFSQGLGSSAQEEMENYNSMVEAEVRNKLKYHLLQMAELRCMEEFGMIPDDLQIEFKPLRELSAVDQENVKTQKFNRLLQAIQSSNITPQEFRDASNKGNLFDVQLDTLEDGVDVGQDDKAKEDEDYDESEPGADDIDTRRPVAGQPLDKVKKNSPIKNSPEFDRAEYEADGGDAWIHPGREHFFTNPGSVDEQKWQKAKDASMKAFGKEKWQFITWFYKKRLGGTFK